jgi:N-acetylglucosamine kinase-like BadF-type ATPase
VALVARRLVVAADGGNSKTDLVLATTDGEVLSRVTGPGTQPHLNGLPATADELAALVVAARELAGAGRDEPVEVGSFYLANVDVPEEETAMHAALAARETAQQLDVGNDTLAALRAGAPRGWGIAVVSGAGINAMGRHQDGRVERFLGIGPWSGDWGGGRGIVQSAVAAAVRAGDGRGPATALAERLVHAFGMPVEEVAFAAHHDRLTQSELLSFAPVVFEAAHAGDDAARQIVERMGDEVVSFAAALLRRMQMTDGDPDVVLGGRVLQAADRLVMGRIRSGLAEVAPNAQIQVLDVAPVAGALAAALELAGSTRDQVATARGHFLGP